MRFSMPPLQVWKLDVQTVLYVVSSPSETFMETPGVEGMNPQTNYSARQLQGVLEVLRDREPRATWASALSRRGSPVGMFWQQGRAPPRPRISQPHPASCSPSTTGSALPSRRQPDTCCGPETLYLNHPFSQGADLPSPPPAYTFSCFSSTRGGGGGEPSSEHKKPID